MSAWIVSENHIRVLVEALYKYEVVKEKTPDEIGYMLWKENHRSVNALYRQRTRTPKYTHDSSAKGAIRDIVRQPLIVLKQIGCYVYQSCEDRAWETSEASRLMRDLHLQVCAGLGIDPQGSYGPAYDAAPWGID